VSSSLKNQGSVTVADASLKGDAALDVGITPGLATAAFDGDSDYIDTAWSTRTNLVTNPTAANDTTGWTGSGLESGPTKVAPEGVLPAELAGVVTAIQASGNGNPDRVMFALPIGGEGLVVGRTYTASVFVRLTASTGAGARLVIRKSTNGEVQAASVNATTVGEWKRLNVTWTAANLEAQRLCIEQTGATTVTFQFTGVMFERASTLGTYFPNPSQLASGESGWSGASNASNSDTGPCARGTTRTFCGVAQASTLTPFEIRSIFSGATATRESLFFAIDEFEGLQFTPDEYTTVATWELGGALSTDPFFYALVWTVGSKIRLYTMSQALGWKDWGSQNIAAVLPEPTPLFISHWSWASFLGSILPFAVYPAALAEALLREFADLMLWPLDDLGADAASHLMLADYTSLTAAEVASKLSSRRDYIGRIRASKFASLRSFEEEHSDRQSVNEVFDDFEANRGTKVGV
jgi:hypothetical protein